MPLFVCDACETVENTALGHYWNRDDARWPPEVRGKALCSACGPTRYPNGSPTGLGRWHDRFTRARPEQTAEMVAQRRREFVYVGRFAENGGPDAP